jgi:hypothetical protein
VSPVRYELEFYIPEYVILHSDRRENLRPHIFGTLSLRHLLTPPSMSVPNGDGQTSRLLHRRWDKTCDLNIARPPADPNIFIWVRTRVSIFRSTTFPSTSGHDGQPASRPNAHTPTAVSQPATYLPNFPLPKPTLRGDELSPDATISVRAVGPTPQGYTNSALRQWLISKQYVKLSP